MAKIRVGFLLAAAALAQTTPAPQFEVASIKPAPDLAAQFKAGNLPHVGTKIDAARVDIGFAGLNDLICLAYKVKPYQLAAPDWLAAARFDVLARIPEGVSKDLVPEMMQALLADRFKLTIHRETKDHTGYALLVGKGGSKLKESVPDEPAPAKDARPAPGTTVVETDNGPVNVKADAKGTTIVGGGPAGTQRFSSSPEGIHLEYSRMTMPLLTDLLTSLAGGMPVVDKTGLKGTFQVVLDIPMAAMNPAGAGAAAGEASEPESRTAAMFQVVQKMGLKLEQRKIPLETIIVDHVEKTPTEN
jgi:uncharacterized protein (TIGR03435 family)